MTAAAPADRLRGRRVLVVGTSSGIGRGVAVLAGRAGAAVALVGRRGDRLAEAAAEAGEGAVAIAGDVRDPELCERAVAGAVDALGGLDGLVFGAALMTAGFVAAADAEQWRATFETNVIGAALVTRHALPHLEASRGRAVYLSSDSVLRPRPGVLAYVASKSALDTMVAGLRTEVPGVEFTRVIVGPTHGTDIASGWDPEVRRQLKDVWAPHGWLDETRMTIEESAAEVLHTLTSPVHVADVLLQPRANAAPRRRRRGRAMSEVPGWAEAWAEATAGFAEGGVPIGAALVRDADGVVLARGRNRRFQTGGLAYHAEIVCLHEAGLIPLAELRVTMLVTTVVPCWMCVGAVLLHGIPRVVVGLASADGTRIPSHDLLEANGVEVVDLGRFESLELMARYVEAHPDDWAEDFGTAIAGVDVESTLDRILPDRTDALPPA